ncbi:hypothetical protein OPQ81_003938 [Rhizoctonia solani]|nr:hypothetical protein OPQ81_003938 [Rhizoctonia solani]
MSEIPTDTGSWSPDPPNGMYEHYIFEAIIQQGLFCSADATGVIHNGLFEVISLPCMALTAAAVEKVLISFKTGVQAENKFDAISFAPVYFSHLATLVAIYKTPEAQNQLTQHLEDMANKLRDPFLGMLRSQPVTHVRSRISPALIAARYRSGEPAATVDASNRHLGKKPVSAPSQQLQIRLGPAARSVSASSTPESDIVDAIYTHYQAHSDTGTRYLPSILAKVSGSSDSEVQAMRAGALKPNMTSNAALSGPPGSDSSDDDASTHTGSAASASHGASESGVSNAGRGKGELPLDKLPTLGEPYSESSNDEADGEGASGLGTSQVLADVSMRTAGVEEDEFEEDEQGEGEGEDQEDEEGENGK